LNPFRIRVLFSCCCVIASGFCSRKHKGLQRKCLSHGIFSGFFFRFLIAVWLHLAFVRGSPKGFNVNATKAPRLDNPYMRSRYRNFVEPLRGSGYLFPSVRRFHRRLFTFNPFGIACLCFSSRYSVLLVLVEEARRAST
jgi:hypothetical protein